MCAKLILVLSSEVAKWRPEFWPRAGSAFKGAFLERGRGRRTKKVSSPRIRERVKLADDYKGVDSADSLVVTQ